MFKVKDIVIEFILSCIPSIEHCVNQLASNSNCKVP